MKLLTHSKPDLDAALSVAAAREFIPGAREAELEFVPAYWNGELDEGDLALDITAGGRGLKGEQGADGTVGSCFALIVARYATEADQEALRSLVTYVDAQDAHGNAVRWLAPKLEKSTQTVLSETGPTAFLNAFKNAHPRNDALVVERMAEIFSGMLETGRARQRAEIEADGAELYGNGTVAILRDNKEFATTAILFERGVQVIVYQDGHNLGVIRKESESLRMDDPALRRIVAAAGEEVGDGDGKWFAHPKGFLFARGTRKAPVTSPSGVYPEDLAWAAARLLANAAGPCWRCDWVDNRGEEYCSHCCADPLHRPARRNNG